MTKHKSFWLMLVGMICSTAATYFTKNGDVIFFFMLAALVALIHENGGFSVHNIPQKKSTSKHSRKGKKSVKKSTEYRKNRFPLAK